MTVDEKRDLLDSWCESKSDCDCCPCDSNPERWCRTYTSLNVPEELLDKTLREYGIADIPSVSSVDHPTHYNQGGIECWDAMEAAYGKDAVKTFCKLNAFKYIWRADSKNGLEDINKAINYLNKYKELNSSE